MLFLLPKQTNHLIKLLRQLMIVFIFGGLLCGSTWIKPLSGKNTKKDKPKFKKISEIKKDFLTKQFKIIQKLSKSGDIFKFRDVIDLSQTPIYGIVKFYPNDKLFTSYGYEFTDRELWLLIFSKKYHNYLLVLIDDGFDDFVYEGKDFEIDRVGIITSQGFQKIDINRFDDFIEFVLPVKEKRVLHTLTQKEYLKHYQNALKKLKEENNPFIPFEETYLAPNYNSISNQKKLHQKNRKKNSITNKQEWKLFFYGDDLIIYTPSNNEKSSTN